MRQAIIAFLLLAFSMVVMSAPTEQTEALFRRRCAKRPAANGKGSSPTLAHKKSDTHLAGAPSKGAPQSKLNRQHTRELYEREDIQLCGYNFRGTSSRRCQGNPAFIQGAWKKWGSFETKDLECDHALELQLSVNALTGAGFCTALDLIKKTLYFIEDQKAVDKQLNAMMFGSGEYGVKEAANSLKMLFYVDKTFNGEKRDWTQKFLAKTARAADKTKKVKAYLGAAETTVVSTVAQQIDSAAKKFLETAATFTTKHFDGSKRPAHNFADENAACDYSEAEAAMKTAVKDFKTQAVQQSWANLKAQLG